MIQEKYCIGNLIKINNPKHRPRENGKYATVTHVNRESVGLQLLDDKYGTNTFGQLLEFIEPIELTEEILFKCGYFPVFSNGKGKVFQYLDGLKYSELIKITYYEDTNKFFLSENKEISKLHHLQNLHYFTHNQELEINL